jgi:DNA-binding NarL/FixJ family response regulator
MRKILIVDDHKLIFDGLKISLMNKFDVDFAASTDEAFSFLDHETYYAIILDVSLGEMKGFDIIGSIPKSTYTFFLSMHKSSMYIQMAKDFGAKGYFLKDESLDLLFNALNRPIDKDFWMSPLVESELKNADVYEASNYDKLSPREQQIFAMLAEDLSYKDIASRLQLSTKTVNNHRDHLMKKLGIETQTALVREAIRIGIISV